MPFPFRLLPLGHRAICADAPAVRALTGPAVRGRTSNPTAMLRAWAWPVPQVPRVAARWGQARGLGQSEFLRGWMRLPFAAGRVPRQPCCWASSTPARRSGRRPWRRRQSSSLCWTDPIGWQTRPAGATSPPCPVQPVRWPPAIASRGAALAAARVVAPSGAPSVEGD